MTTTRVVGTIPHDEVSDRTFPIVVGGIAATSTPSAVSDLDAVRAYLDEYGQFHVVISAGSNNIGKIDPVISTPATYNLTLTLANTEYSQALPSSCRFFEFQCRTAFAVRFAFVTGKVAAPTAPYMTLKSGNYYYSPSINQGATPGTLYLASAEAGVVVEIIAWT